MNQKKKIIYTLITAIITAAILGLTYLTVDKKNAVDAQPFKLDLPVSAKPEVPKATSGKKPVDNKVEAIPTRPPIAVPVEASSAVKVEPKVEQPVSVVKVAPKPPRSVTPRSPIVKHEKPTLSKPVVSPKQAWYD